MSVVDAVNFFEDYGQAKYDARRLEILKSHLECAQLVVVNKTDSVENSELLKLEAAIGLILANVSNQGTKVIRAQFGELALSSIINTSLFSLERASQHSHWVSTKGFSLSLSDRKSTRLNSSHT